MSGPLSQNPNPTSFDAGALGPIFITGAIGALAFRQDNPAPEDRASTIDLSNAQVFLQNRDGWLRFFVQAGWYSLSSLGSPYIKAGTLTRETYGWVPQAFVKLGASDGFSVEAGKLPTLIGNEYTFSFENMNIERGLLWNQTPSVSRGIQANYVNGPLTVMISWNDGYYSDRFDWASALIAYAWNGGDDSVSLTAGGNLGRTGFSSLATPLAQNNSRILNLVYSHTDGRWSLSPYLQVSVVRASHRLGLDKGASTFGLALLASYAIDAEWKLAARGETIQTSGGQNMLYGPGSGAWSLTLTPTYQKGSFFARTELSYVALDRAKPGLSLGPKLDDTSQTRLVVETGFLL